MKLLPLLTVSIVSIVVLISISKIVSADIKVTTPQKINNIDYLK